MNSRIAIGVALLVGLTACGGKQALKPKEGMAAVPTARGATAPQTAQELMTPSPQSRPERNAELLTQSKERQDDPFDLPPRDR